MAVKIIGLSELWDEITDYVGDLMDYAYIDDQIGINIIWDLVEEYKKKNNADNEPWNLKEKIINDIYFMFYDVYNSMPDPFDDLIEIICSSKEDKIRYAEILYTADDKYVKYEGAILLAELGCTEKVIDYFENYRGYEREKVYGLMLDYYAGSDYEKAVETANNALKNCRKDQTEFMIFLLKDAQKSGDEAKFKKLFRNAHVRKLVNSDVIDSMFEIDNDSDGGKSDSEKIYGMLFSKVYPMLIAKAERKGRTRDEVYDITEWLTGYSSDEISEMLDSEITYGDFFLSAPELNPSRKLIKGVICGIRVEDIEEPLMQEIRYLDKLVDELAKGKSMDKIKR